MQEEPKRLLGYVRTSTDEQGNSLTDQDTALHRFCDLYGHELVDVIVEEDVSASVPLEKRPRGRELMDRLRDGGADGIVITELDRAFRLTVDGILQSDWFTDQGLVICTINERVDTSTPDGWLSFAIKLVTGEWERRKTRWRTRRTLAGLRERGKLYSGTVPYGCVKTECGREPDDNGGVRIKYRLYRDPETWGAREMIVRMREDEELSLRAICAELQERGVPAPSGGRLWHISTLQGILESHDGLKHIPLRTDAHEAPVSATAPGVALPPASMQSSELRAVS